MVSTVLVVAAIFPALIWATNFSAQPCHNGSCRWEHADDYGYGRFELTGPISSISDLTPLAGWTILDCNPSSAAQDIRVVCHDPSKGCDHLYLNGAHHTIVKLPDECGSMAFAFVKDEWVHDDQTIPRHKRHFLAHRDSVASVVKGITLSTNYSELDHTKHGQVSFDAFGLSGSALADQTSDCISVEGWDCTGTTTPQLFNYTHTDTIFSKSFDCPQQGSTPGYAGDVNVNLDTNVNGSLAFGWALAGTVLHPRKEVEFYFGINTTISGTLDLNANLNGTLSSGKMTLLELDLIPMSGIPGVLNIGPAFKISAEADAVLSANVDLSVDIDFGLVDAKVYFPNSTGLSGQFNKLDSSGLQLSASPSASVEGNVSVHLIPSLAIDFDFVHFFDTSVSLDLDASAALDMTLHAGLDASTSTDGTSSGTDANWGGCVNATTSLNLDVSADMDLPPIYTKDSSFSLWGDTWSLYSTCFNGSAPIGRRAYLDRGDAVMDSYRDRVLNRYTKNVSPAGSATPSLPSGCGSIGKGSLVPVHVK